MKYCMYFQGETIVEADSYFEAEEIAMAKGPDYYYIKYAEEIEDDEASCK